MLKAAAAPATRRSATVERAVIGRGEDICHGSSASKSDEEGVVDELIEQLKSRVGLDDAKAHSAAQTVLDFLKQRLPGPVASQLDSAISGGGAQGVAGKIGDMLGKKTA